MSLSAAIIFIGTNKYLNFFPKYYESCEEFLFPDLRKQYFVFTDGELEGELPENITYVQIPHKEWLQSPWSDFTRSYRQKNF